MHNGIRTNENKISPAKGNQGENSSTVRVETTETTQRQRLSLKIDKAIDKARRLMRRRHLRGQVTYTRTHSYTQREKHEMAYPWPNKDSTQPKRFKIRVIIHSRGPKEIPKDVPLEIRRIVPPVLDVRLHLRAFAVFDFAQIIHDLDVVGKNTNGSRTETNQQSTSFQGIYHCVQYS